MKEVTNVAPLALIDRDGNAMATVSDATLFDHDGVIVSESTAVSPDGSSCRTVFIADDAGPLAIKFHVTDAAGSVTVTVYDLVKRNAPTTDAGSSEQSTQGAA